MNKKEFLEEIRRRLSHLPNKDVEKSIEYYEEMIDDSIEDGLSEEDAVASIGSVDEIVKVISSDVDEKAKSLPKRKIPVWQIILIILGSPIWGSLLISVFAVAVSIYAVIWSVLITLYAVDLTLAFCGVCGIFRAVTMIASGNGAEHILLALGIGCIGIGLSILLFFACHALAKLLIFLTKLLFRVCKKAFQGKRREK